MTFGSSRVQGHINVKNLSDPVLAIDLRLPDRITVRLTEEAAASHAEAIQEKIRKWGRKA